MAQDRIHIVRLPHATLSAPIRIVPIDSESFQATASVLQRCKIPPMSGSIDMIVFPEAYKRIGEKVKLEVPVLVKAGIRIEEGANPKITASEIMSATIESRR